MKAAAGQEWDVATIPPTILPAFWLKYVIPHSSLKRAINNKLKNIENENNMNLHK